MEYFMELQERPNSKNGGLTCESRYAWVTRAAILAVDILSLMLIFVVFCITIVCVRDATTTLEDVRAMVPEAARSLGDLEDLLPEVNRTLSLVRKICEAPQFREFCEPPL